ncbi:hypothetical protein AciX8_4901 [Granulicella mallensis MP5ACTX8]|uniref:Uncharacterized protein n=1 Tax=Granulicella mallensis (strain ATCC BAA-1857 / DSM 23137 / MP5ACTX8) TaxID=682795 RepID=G8NZQ0_GRAMM|nr:hypothetical protein AciX8_4901 [Granulicella mallensis MP5ACTX8]
MESGADKKRLYGVSAESKILMLERNQARCMHSFCFVFPRRIVILSIASQLLGTRSRRTPRVANLPIPLCLFSTSSARAWTFMLEKVLTVRARSSPSGSFGPERSRTGAPRKSARRSAQDDVSGGICDSLFDSSDTSYSSGLKPRILWPSLNFTHENVISKKMPLSTKESGIPWLG